LNPQNDLAGQLPPPVRSQAQQRNAQHLAGGAQLVIQRRQGQLATLRQFQVGSIVQGEPEAIG
jgi:hypothetical protein